MDQLEILEKYSSLDIKDSRYLLADDSVIIGIEPDEENRMIYVVEKDGEIWLEYGGELKIVKDLVKRSGEILTRSGKVREDLL